MPHGNTLRRPNNRATPQSQRKREEIAKNSSWEKFKSRTLEEEMTQFLRKKGCPHALQDKFSLQLTLNIDINIEKDCAEHGSEGGKVYSAHRAR